MTENEAIKELSYDNTAYGGRCTEEVRRVAIHALSEIQQYRAIGTVKQIRIREAQFKRLSEGYLNDLTSLREYQAIGTIEEFKALKEKNEPKELAEHNFQDEVHHYLCPSCRSIVSCTQNYCDECGQALET